MALEDSVYTQAVLNRGSSFSALPVGARVTAINFDRSAEALAIADEKGQIGIWDVERA